MKGLAALAAAASLGIASYAVGANALDRSDIGTWQPCGNNEECFISDPNPNIFPEEYQLITLAGTLILNGPVKCGLGALINDINFEECIGPALVGGLINFTGMEIARYNEYPFVGAAGKLVSNLGISMADNVAMGIPMLDRYQVDFGPVLFSIEHMTTDAELELYFQPGGAAGILANFALGNRLELLETLYNLIPVFTFPNISGELFGAETRGYAIGDVISYGRGDGNSVYLPSQTMSHEFNHSLFYQDFRFIDDLLFSEDARHEWHLSLGPDIGAALLSGPASLLYAIDGKDALDIYRYFPFEFAAYSMELDP